MACRQPQRRTSRRQPDLADPEPDVVADGVGYISG